MFNNQLSNTLNKANYSFHIYDLLNFGLICLRITNDFPLRLWKNNFHVISSKLSHKLRVVWLGSSYFGISYPTMYMSLTYLITMVEIFKDYIISPVKRRII